MYFTTELIHALPSAERRIFNREEAASYVSVSVGHFDSLVGDGTMPQALPIRGVKRWDKAALDRTVDKMSGFSTIPGQRDEPLTYDAWRNARGQG